MNALASVVTQGWMTRADQAARWSREMLEPGRAVVVGLGRSDDITLLDNAGRPLLDEPCTGSALRQLVAKTAGPVRILAYETVAAASRITQLAAHHHVDLAHLEETEIWGCVSRARSVALGCPDHSYPLQSGPSAHDRAASTLAALQQIALEGARHG